MKRLLCLILSLMLLLPAVPVTAAGITTLTTAKVSNITLPSPGEKVSDYTNTIEAGSTKYAVVKDECYWSNESKMRLSDTNAFSQGAIYYYTITLRTNGDYVFAQDTKLSITDGVVDPAMQITIINAGKEIRFENAYKITCGVGQVRTIDHIELSKSVFYYTGKAQKPTVKVFDDTGAKITGNYKVSYSGDCKKVGVYTVTVEPKNSTCVGSASATFTINPSVPQSVKVKAAKKAIKVSWKRPKSGKPEAYTVFVYSDKACKKLVTSAKVSGLKKTIGGLKSGKTYYVKVDCYVASDQGYLVSKQTAAKKVSVK